MHYSDNSTMGKSNSFLVSSFLVCFLSLPVSFPRVETAIALPLSTRSRYIVDRTGRQRVKLACVNWAAHLEPVVAEGLSKQPLDAISNRIAEMGFNCVRLTWPLFLATNKTLASLTVQQSFADLGLHDAICGFKLFNPSILPLSLMDAFKEVVSSLDGYGLMVILDNHISQPGWCCGSNDGSGYFGDEYFDPSAWLTGLIEMATIFGATRNVIGMSLRNELRGREQNIDNWYRYMQQGAEAVHSANPHILVILSGLSYATDLSFLQNRSVSLTFKRKLVFEIHWYVSSDRKVWESSNINEACGLVKDHFSKRGGFLLKKRFPLFVSEFGVEVAGTNEIHNRYFSCFLSVASEVDFEWAVWTLVGSYYRRDGVVGLDETHGVLTWNWRNLRNPDFLNRLSTIQQPTT